MTCVDDDPGLPESCPEPLSPDGEMFVINIEAWLASGIQPLVTWMMATKDRYRPVKVQMRLLIENLYEAANRTTWLVDLNGDAGRCLLNRLYIRRERMLLLLGQLVEIGALKQVQEPQVSGLGVYLILPTQQNAQENAGE